jgi:DNA polymerase-3 subunit gamma/tau
MSLYRKYRPKTFEDMAGQGHVISTLQQAVKQDKLSHAYLFSGTRGTGKTSTARILAKIILTRGMEEGPLKRQVEESVDDGNLVDLVEIDAASNRGIDDIRGLLEKINFSPVVGKAKVYIIDEVHMLTREAFNALLKTLEEPPSYAYFILATTELHKIPPTIQSRCQRYLFRQIREDDIVARLKHVAEHENIKVQDEALKAIAHHVQGGLRDAISLLDQLQTLEYVTLDDVRSRIGESGFEYVETVMKALEAGDRQTLLETVRRMEEVGVPLDHFVRLLLGRVREDLHRAVDQKRSTTDLEKMLGILLEAVRDVRSAPVPGLVIESALLHITGGSAEDTEPAPVRSAPARVAPAAAAPSTPTIAAPVQTPVAAPVVEKPVPAPVAAAVPAPDPAPAAPVAAGSVSLMDVKKIWPDLVQTIEPASAKMSLKNGALSAVEGNTLVVRFSSAFHRDKVSSPEAARNIEVALQKFLGSHLNLKAISEGDAPADSPSAPSVPDDDVDLASAAADIF